MTRYALALLLLLPALLTGQEEPPERLAHPLLLADAGMVQADGFYIDVYEFPNQRGAMPKVDVSWEEARDLCRAQGKRLCSEQEWQVACSGSRNLLFGYGSEFVSGRCNTPYLEEGIWKRDRGTVPSGTFGDCRSDYGVYDMIGNVWEWTADRYAPGKNWFVVRGGSWFHNVNLARSDSRYGSYLTPEYRLDLIGFRCCRSTPPDESPRP